MTAPLWPGRSVVFATETQGRKEEFWALRA